MKCHICQRSDEEKTLYKGIYENEIVSVCEDCANEENTPLIKKATPEQLKQAERKISVRERMGRISGFDDPLGKDNSIALKHFAKIKILPKKQQPENLVENYHWELQMARRRKKMTLYHLSQKTGIPQESLDSLEKGQLPKDYESFIGVLEEVLEIKIFKTHEKLIFHLPEKPLEKKQKEIIAKAKENMEVLEGKEQEKKKIINDISKGKFDFSKREKLENITLNDLIEMKRQREKKQAFEKEKQENEEFFGDELEIEEES